MIVINMLNVLLVKSDIMADHKKFSRDMNSQNSAASKNVFQNMKIRFFSDKLKLTEFFVSTCA